MGAARGRLVVQRQTQQAQLNHWCQREAPAAWQHPGVFVLARQNGRALPGRSGEDVTSPEDTRAYRLGDPFKRIHWKLSIRARELIVRRFEIPEPPDT